MGRFIVDGGWFGKYGTCIMMNADSGEMCELIYDYGLTIHRLRLLQHDGSFMDVIHGHESVESLRDKPFAYSGALMVPYAGRIPNATYRFAGRAYRLPVNTRDGHAIHGLLYDRRWRIRKVVEGDSFSSIEFEYIIKPDEFSGYPFYLRIDVKVVFDLYGLQVETKAKNLGDCDLPVSFGWHPYINAFGGSVDECFLSLPAEELVVLDSVSKVPTGEIIPVEGSPLDFREPRKVGSLTMDNTFRSLRFRGGRAYTRMYNPNMDFGVQLWQDEGFPYLNIYIPKHRRSIAIEPLTGSPNCFNIPRFGLRILSPSEEIKATFGIQKIL